MRKPIVFSMATALLLFVGTSTISSSAQDATNDQTPTFYRLVPGTYVNGWPRFTIHYPKDWVERRPAPQDVFRAGTLEPSMYSGLMVAITHNPDSLDRMGAMLVTVFRLMATDVTLVSDTPVRLRDGSPAQEIELRYVRGATPIHWFGIATKKGDTLILTGVFGRGERVDEGLKKIPYSLEFQPDNDKPVEVPPDVQEFLERNGNDILSHDVAKVMANYSDRYLNSGTKKVEAERDNRRWIGTVTSLTGATTEFVRLGDRAYLTGYTVFNFGTYSFPTTSIIKENGEWKWYGNQRDPAP